MYTLDCVLFFCSFAYALSSAAFFTLVGMIFIDRFLGLFVYGLFSFCCALTPMSVVCLGGVTITQACTLGILLASVHVIATAALIWSVRKDAVILVIVAFHSCAFEFAF